MYCTQCGCKNTDESNFCKKCGSHLRAVNPAVGDRDTGNEPVNDEKVSTLLDRAFELYDSGEVDQAFEVCCSALRLNPSSVTGRSLLSTIYEKQGNLDAAIRQMERVVEANPNSGADLNRLESLQRRLKLKLAEQDEVIIPKSSAAPVSDWVRNPLVLATCALVGMLLIAVILLAFRGGPEDRNAVLPVSPARTTAPAGDESGFSQNPPARPTVSGSVFDGLGSTANSQAAARSQQADSQESAQDVQQPRYSASAPAPAPRSAPSPPAPAPYSNPQVSITRVAPEPPRSNDTTTAAASVSGKELQRQAKAYAKDGDRANAVSVFRKAIAAFRTEATRDGGGFEAQQGVRSCQLELKLLGENE